MAWKERVVWEIFQQPELEDCERLDFFQGMLVVFEAITADRKHLPLRPLSLAVQQKIHPIDCFEKWRPWGMSRPKEYAPELAEWLCSSRDELLADCSAHEQMLFVEGLLEEVPPEPLSYAGVIPRIDKYTDLQALGRLIAAHAASLPEAEGQDYLSHFI